MARRSAAVPKYHQITQDIIKMIQSGRLAPHALAPSENEIIETYRVSNTTARKAMQELTHSGWVQRIKGRGTYVLERKIERSASRILGFSSNMLEAGHVPSTRLVGLHCSQAGRSISINGRDYVLQGPVCMIQRLRLGDSIPIMFETRYISTHFCPGIQKKDLERSLYEIYEKDFNLQLTEIRQVLSTIILEEAMQVQFDLKSPVPAFRVEGVTFCGKDMILEIEESIYRGDIYRFTVTATR